jgi:hypothetical protein
MGIAHTPALPIDGVPRMHLVLQESSLGKHHWSGAKMTIDDALSGRGSTGTFAEAQREPRAQSGSSQDYSKSPFADYTECIRISRRVFRISRSAVSLLSTAQLMTKSYVRQCARHTRQDTDRGSP